MRIPYVAENPTGLTAEEEAIYQRISARRAPRPLQPLDLALLHNPVVADGWNSFLGAIRTGTSLSADIREIAICRVAVLNGATYEWKHHAPLAKEAGLGEKGTQRLMVNEMSEGLYNGVGNGKGLSEKQFVVCKFTDEMTRNVKVSEGTFGEARKFFSEKEIMELTATVAAYNCVSRFLVALDVGESNELPIAPHLEPQGAKHISMQ